MLIDGFEFVVDLRKSRGCRIVDAISGKSYLDFFSFFASSAVGMNHPKLTEETFLRELGRAAVNKPSNSDAFTVELAEFVDTFSRVLQPDYLPHLFFIDGGALAVENAVKTAFDWKVRKNFRKGYREERGQQIIHFRRAFHGRSGYTLSMTNTDPVKTDYFPKFAWPRIHNPAVRFPLTEEHLAEAMKEEELALRQIREAIAKNPDDIAGLIIEPIQAEGGDNHFRKEFFGALRQVCDESDILLIFDEVQTGVGLTGKMWAHEYFVRPDIMAFGKKTHVCGCMAGSRVDEAEENVFQKRGRINSTFGGNLVDMVRFRRIMEIIAEERLVENAAVNGQLLLEELSGLAGEFPSMVGNVRGRGLMCAMDLESPGLRDELRRKAYAMGLIIIGCGERTIRFRPPLIVAKGEVQEGISIIRSALEVLSTEHT